MGNFLFKKFIKNYEDVKNPEVRDSYGKLAGIVGIISNLLLCAMKMLVGFISGSIAIVADAVNNLADASSSIITLIGFKLASLPEDEEHPYGHARIEYIAGMVVSLIIIVVGVELGKSSFDKILHPEPLEFSIYIIIVLLLAICIKIWQALFNVSAGKRINSVPLMATGADSRNDVIATAAVLISIIAGHIFNVHIDGYIGVLVALFIIWSGISLVRETISPLLGEAPDPELVKEIENITLSYDGVIGIHDLVVHNYGPGKIFASIHIEVDSSVDVMISHDLVDNIERRLQHDLNIFVTAHMDPVNLSDPNRVPVSHILDDAISGLDGVLNYHDLRIVPGQTHTNIIFDVVLSPDCKISHDKITDIICSKIKEYNPAFFCVINYDTSYIKKSPEEVRKK